MTTAQTNLTPWRALHWEPVTGTGERLMVGVVYNFGGEWDAARILRDDVLSALYGKAAAGARRLIDTGLSAFREAAAAGDSLDRLGVPLAGLHPTELRMTEALSVPDLLRIAALQYSSMANLDKLDHADEADLPEAQEDAVRRFSTDVREAALSARPDLRDYFGRTAVLVHGGDRVKFGYASHRLLAHFNVISPMRNTASLRDARARLFELDKGRTVSGLEAAALISGVPRSNDPMLGDRQRARLREMLFELDQEASSVGVLFRTAADAGEAADVLLGLEAA